MTAQDSLQSNVKDLVFFCGFLSSQTHRTAVLKLTNTQDNLQSNVKDLVFFCGCFLDEIRQKVSTRNRAVGPDALYRAVVPDVEQWS